MFQNYFNSQVDDFDEFLFSHIASSGGGNRDAVRLTRNEFTDGFETFLDKGTISITYVAGQNEIQVKMKFLCSLP